METRRIWFESSVNSEYSKTYADGTDMGGGLRVV